MQIKRPAPEQPIPSEAKAVFRGTIFTVYQWEQELFDGTKEIFEKIGRSDTVSVIPVTKTGEILLTKQEQPGLIQPFWGTAGGRIDGTETPLAAAKRELLEETGYTSDDIILWRSMQPSGMIDWAIYIFVARNCTWQQEQQLDGGEKIEVIAFSFDQFVEKALSEEFRDTEVTLQILKLKEANRLSELKTLLYP